MDEKFKKWMPVILAITIAAIALVWYMLSGRSSLDLNVREIVNKGNDEIEEINATDSEKVQITCKNGEKYEISFTKGQDNYDELIFNACSK